MECEADLSALPYWQVNVPFQERTAQCPDFLVSVSVKDRGILSTPDSEYRADTWEEVCEKIRCNRIDLFRRKPSDLRRYLAYSWQLKKDYGSVLNFMLSERLGWTQPILARGRPFQYAEDLRILRNDWPYGIDERIVHLVIWTKFDLPDEPASGALSESARAEVDSFIQRTFNAHMPPGQVAWFKNPAALKSIHAVEHFHVMLFDPPEDLVRQVTGNGEMWLQGMGTK